MKKSLLAAGLLLGFAWGVLVWGIGYVDQGKEKVELKEVVLYGDLAKAKGITLQIDSQWNQKLFWSTKYQVGSLASPETKFCFQQTGRKQGKDFLTGLEWTEEREIAIDLPFIQFTAIMGEDLLNDEGIELPYRSLFQEIASRTAAGELYTEEVYLADYVSYYALCLEVQSSKISSMQIPEDAQERVNQLIQIPILPNQKGKVSVRKNRDGKVTEIRYENIEGGVSVCTSGWISDSGCYFSFACYNSEGELLDREFLETEYGVYILPFYWEKTEQLYSENYAVMEYEKIKCICPLKEEEGWIVAMQEEGDQYLFVTKKAEKLMLTVIKKDTKEIVQQLDLLDWKAEDQFQSLEQQENTLFVGMKSGKFCFLVKDLAGWYQKKLYGDLDQIEDRWEREKLIRHHTFRWDGERLAIAGFLYNRNSVYLMVFQEEGMVFLGLYQHSGDLDWKLGWQNIPVQPIGKPILQMQ